MGEGHTPYPKTRINQGWHTFPASTNVRSGLSSAQSSRKRCTFNCIGIGKNSILLSCKIESLFSFVSHQEFFLKWNHCPVKGFHDGSEGKKSACSGRDTSLIPGLARSPGEGKWQPTPVFLPEKSHGQESLEGYSPKGHRESDMTKHQRTHTHTHKMDVKASIHGDVFDIHVLRHTPELQRKTIWHRL